MKTYSLLKFLSEPAILLLDSGQEYCFRSISSAGPVIENSDAVAKITVPSIQRDYAQGRSENQTMREKFIEMMFSHLETEEQLKLDFIYGTLQHTPNGMLFLPLDGQQRLTTLYLIHWYIIQKEAVPNSDDYVGYKRLLSKFSYETRDTSRRFFSELINFRPDGRPIDAAIQGSYWFSDHFKLDPTVSGVINTLKTIEGIYLKSSKKGSLLGSLLSDTIVFYVLPMDKFRLTDDLYIKLNARGKILSSFENFKADFVGFTKKDLFLHSNLLLSNGITMPHYDYIANKFDNDWSNLFWSEVKKKISSKEDIQPSEILDAYFFRFIHRLFINNFILDYIGTDINKDSVYKELLYKEAELTYSDFDFYTQNHLIDSTVVKEMETLLDFYLKHNEAIQNLVMTLWDKDLKWDIYREKYTMTDRMLFDAVNQYILNNAEDQLDEERFSEWIRIVWNLISDPDIRSIEASKTVMGVIRSIAAHSGSFYAKIVDGSLDNFISSLKNIHKGQLQEEKQKAALMDSSNSSAVQWKQQIYRAETHKLFEGSIGFLLQDAATPEELHSRFSLAEKIFDKNRPFELLKLQSHSLMRYVIAGFKNYDELKAFNYSDNEINWKTYLRRNENVKSIISDLLNHASIEKVCEAIQQAIQNNSGLTNANSKEINAHKNLYFDNSFHSWMQNDGVNRLRWRDSHIYAFRQSAWYSKIMIDGYRNELTQALIERFSLEQPNFRCSSSNYFMGEHYELFRNLDEMRISFYFDIYNKLHIGLWSEYNTPLASELDKKNEWIEIHTFDIDNITGAGDISSYISSIEETITDPGKDSLIISMV